MPRLRVFVLSLLACNFLACSRTQSTAVGGTSVSSQFLNEYTGQFEEQSGSLNRKGEELSIHKDGRVEVLKLRQVGTKGNALIPYPTVCSFRLKGQITDIIQLDLSARQRTTAQGKQFLIPATHKMIFNVYQVALSDELKKGSTTSQACLNFQEKMNQSLPTYAYGLELFGQGVMRLHTSGGKDYMGGQRSESTLDEVFMRQN